MKVRAIMSSRTETKPSKTPLLVKLTQGANLGHVEAIKWGQLNEQKANEAFFHQAAMHHIAPKLHLCGLKLLRFAS